MISIVCKQQYQCLTRNPSKLWGLTWSSKTNIKKHCTTKPFTTTDPTGKHEYSKVRCCKNTWVCKQIWTIMKWIIEYFRLFAAPPPQGSSSQWAERVVTRTRFIITGLTLQSSLTHTHTLSPKSSPEKISVSRLFLHSHHIIRDTILLLKSNFSRLQCLPQPEITSG